MIPTSARQGRFLRWFARVQMTPAVRQTLYREMAALMRTGISRSQICQMLFTVKSREGRDTTRPVAVVMRDVLRSLRDGASFAAAMRPWVPPMDAMIFEAGENSDDFADQLEEYCEVIQARQDMRAAVFGGLAYPVILLVVLFAVLKIFGSRLFPQIGEILPPEQWRGAGQALAALGWFARDWVDMLAAAFLAAIALVVALMPRWTRAGRSVADRLPLFSTYRMVTGVSFLLSLAGLLRGGLPAARALARIQEYAPPYVRHRVERIHRLMLNGHGLGAAIADAGTGWPDYETNLSIKIFGQSQDLSAHLSRLSRDWLKMTVARIERQMNVLKGVMIFVVFVLIVIIISGMFEIQQQIADQISMG